MDEEAASGFKSLLIRARESHSTFDSKAAPLQTVRARVCVCVCFGPVDLFVDLFVDWRLLTLVLLSLIAGVVGGVAAVLSDWFARVTQQHRSARRTISTRSTPEALEVAATSSPLFQITVRNLLKLIRPLSFC